MSRATLVLVLVCSGCATIERAPTPADATTDAERLLTGYQNSDYALFSSSWTQRLKDEVSEERFCAFQTLAQSVLGRPLERVAVQPLPSDHEGLTQYAVTWRFEHQTAAVRLGYLAGAGLDVVVFEQAPTD